MTDAVQAVQTAAVTALQAHPALSAELAGIYDGPPPRAMFPYVSIGDGLVSDWSTKSEAGREIRLALTVWDDGEDALAAMPRDLPGWRIASNVFLRSLVVRNPAGPWAGLVEHRLRLLAMP